MIKHCRRCGDKLPDNRTNQHYCPHCADITEFERREQRLRLSPKRKRTQLKAQETDSINKQSITVEPRPSWIL